MLRKQQSSVSTDIYIELKKLKKRIVEASDYIHLEKCLQKINTLKKQIKTYGSRDKKELSAIIQTCQILVNEKTNYFKSKIKRILYDDTNSQQQKFKETKLLKNYKSAQILVQNKNQSDGYTKKASKKKNEQFMRQRTQNNQCNCTIDNKTNSNNNIDKGFQNRVNIIQQKIANDQLKNIFEYKQQAILIQYEQRIRQIALDREQLKIKNKLLNEQNIQLKNRILNEHKRQNDYIDNLKQQIFAINHELGKSHKELLAKAYQMDQLVKINQFLKEEIKKTSIRNEQDKIKYEKELSHTREVMKNHMEEYRRQVQHINKQKLGIENIKQQILKQQQQKSKIIKKLEYSLKQNQQLKIETMKWKNSLLKMQGQFDKLQMELCDLRDAYNQKDVYCHKLQDQLYQVRQAIIAIEEQQNYIEARKQLQKKGKVNKLHQIKCLLQDMQQ